MDFFLDRITSQAINYAVRSGITLTAGYALQHAGKLIKHVEAPEDRNELQRLQERLQNKIRIISPAIDMIELISARGNTTLESAVDLTGQLRQEIQSIAQKLQRAAAEEASARQGNSKRAKVVLQLNLKSIITDLKDLIDHIEDAVPFLSLAITASGAKVSSGMPSTISPSRLLQASTFMTAADSCYSLNAGATQVGPTFTLSLYMLFAGHIRPQFEEDVRLSTWKEVIHKARLKLIRVPLASLGHLDHHGDEEATPFDMRASKAADDYAYQLHIIEDLDDDRVHTYDENESQPGPFEDVALAGIRELVPVHEISKIFYADTGKILNIGGDGDIHRPVLLLKRDLNAIPPRRMSPETSSWDPLPETVDSEGEQENSIQSALDSQFSFGVPSTLSPERDDTSVLSQVWRIPPDLDPEWLAFEVYTEQPDTEDDSIDEDISPEPSRPSTGRTSINGNILSSMSALKLRQGQNDDSADTQGDSAPDIPAHHASTIANPFPQIRTSLSLLETLLRLASLQQFQQMSHLSIEDEFLNFFLSEAATTGAATGDDVERRRLREDARQRVGFDPYDESPIKRRGEEYQYRGGASQAEGYESGTPEHSSPAYDDTSVLPSIEESSPAPRESPGVIMPRRWHSLGSDFPPLGIRSRSTPRITPDLSTPHMGNSPSISSPRVVSTPAAKKDMGQAKGSPLVKETKPDDEREDTKYSP